LPNSRFSWLLRSHDLSVRKKVAAKLVGKEHCFILGKGYAEPIAYEGALKIKVQKDIKG